MLHLDDGKETPLGVQKKIANYLKDEIKYVSHLPVTLKFNQFLFVHAGIEKEKIIRTVHYHHYLKCSIFMIKDIF